MQCKTILFSTLLCLLLTATLSQAQQREWSVDHAHSNIYFDSRHTFVTVRGLFEDYTGTVLLDQEDLTNSQVDFDVQVRSINTNITRRDDHLRSNDFFSARQFPRMSFVTTGITHVQDNEYLLEGDLTIKDVTKPISATMVYFRAVENPMKQGEQVAGIEATFTLNRLDYNVGTGKFLEMGLIADEVDVLVALEVLREM